MIILVRHYIAAKTSSPGKVYMHLVLQTAVPTMKQAVQNPETTVFIKPATLICRTAEFQPLCRMEHFLPFQRQTKTREHECRLLLAFDGSLPDHRDHPTNIL